MLRTIKLIIYYFAYQLAAVAVVIGAWMLLNGFRFPDNTDGTLLELNTYATILGSVGFAIHLVLAKYCPLNRLTLSSVSGKTLGAAALLIVGMGCWSNYLVEALGIPDKMKDVFEALMNNPWGVFTIAILAPVFEEIFFRGAIQGHLTRKWKNPWWGIVVTSLIFGAVHGNPVQIPFAAITGIALGWMYYRTGSLLPGMLMHFINNSASVVLYHLTKNLPETTLTGMLGNSGAIALVLAGAAVTVLCVLYLQKKALPRPIVWKEEQASIRQENDLTI